MSVTVITLNRGHIGCVKADRIVLERFIDFERVNLAEDAVLLFWKDAMEKGEPHNAIASLLAQRHVYGPAMIVGKGSRYGYADAPARYVETYTISRQEKQDEEENA